MGGSGQGQCGSKLGQVIKGLSHRRLIVGRAKSVRANNGLLLDRSINEQEKQETKGAKSEYNWRRIHTCNFILQHIYYFSKLLGFVVGPVIACPIISLFNKSLSNKVPIRLTLTLLAIGLTYPINQVYSRVNWRSEKW